ncbi:MAG TPA: hypothetical protein VEG38_22325, partial [Acidimicrobiia bacterium]|nr:hypothetical protein [Acidimicrobiia bacterium]
VAEAGPVVLGGNSFGCQVATEIAVRHPGLVRCLVLATSFTARPQPGRPADRLGKRADQSLVVTGCRAR